MNIEEMIKYRIGDSEFETREDAINHWLVSNLGRYGVDQAAAKQLAAYSYEVVELLDSYNREIDG